MRHVLLLALLLTGCATTPAKPPQVVQVSVPTYVPIPPELTADCTMPTLADRTVNSGIDFAIKAKASLLECTSRMQAIRQVQGAPVK